jgi:Outer membrane lipoprotein-sorting protein
VGSDKMAVLEQVPTDPMSGYSKRVVTVNLSKNHRMEKIEYFDKKGTKLKTMTYQNYTLYAGKYWRASSLQMVNHQSGRKTELAFSNYKFGTSLTEDDFSVNNL